MSSINNAILSRIYGHGRGWVFSPGVFSDLANPKTINSVLTRLVRKGKLVHLARGFYCFPKVHSDIGVLHPSSDDIARAIAKRDRIRLLPTGAHAANLLGLSEQVPAKLVFLTDGKARKLKIGRIRVELKRASPKVMALAGTDSGLVIEALRYLGAKNIDSKTVSKLRRLLHEETKVMLVNNLSVAPGWMVPILKLITE